MILRLYLLDKADKKAEQLRIEKMEQQRQDREDEIREMSLKLRRKYATLFPFYKFLFINTGSYCYTRIIK